MSTTSAPTGIPPTNGRPSRCSASASASSDSTAGSSRRCFRRWRRISGLPEGEIGRLAGILGILWGVFAIFSGRLSDAIGHRKVLIPAIVLFSLMSGFSGMVQGLVCARLDPRNHGRDGRHVLPDELHSRRRRIETRAPRLQSGAAAERLRADGIRARPDHCGATAATSCRRGAGCSGFARFQGSSSA